MDSYERWTKAVATTTPVPKCRRMKNVSSHVLCLLFDGFLSLDEVLEVVSPLLRDKEDASCGMNGIKMPATLEARTMKMAAMRRFCMCSEDFATPLRSH